MTPPSFTGVLIVIVFLVFVVLWWIDHKEARTEREASAARLADRDQAFAEERAAAEARAVRRDEEMRAERRRLDEEARIERRETQELIRQLTRNTDAMGHAVTGLEKTVGKFGTALSNLQLTVVQESSKND
jgi:predicted Holliday junction resolvase-like endonuclease